MHHLRHLAVYQREADLIHRVGETDAQKASLLRPLGQVSDHACDGLYASARAQVMETL